MYGVKFSLWLTGAVAPQAVAGRHSSTHGCLPAGCISNPAAADDSRQYLPGGMGLPHPPANQASYPGRPVIIISVGA